MFIFDTLYLLLDRQTGSEARADESRVPLKSTREAEYRRKTEKGEFQTESNTKCAHKSAELP